MFTRSRRSASRRAAPGSTCRPPPRTMGAMAIAASDALLAEVRYNDDGLVPAIVQAEDTGDVLMMAWMNEEALRSTFEQGRMIYWSRSRQELWRKGDTSGDRQWLRRAYL